MVKGKIKRAYYRAVGQHLMTDSLTVEIEVNGEIYKHEVPNTDWSYQTPALMFMGYADIKPTDFDGGQYVFEEEVAVPVTWNESEGTYLMTQQPLILGSQLLSKAEWFNPDGDVWNSGEAMAFGGMSVEPGTGNKAGVEIKE